jgi:hypothetical protein
MLCWIQIYVSTVVLPAFQAARLLNELLLLSMLLLPLLCRVCRAIVYAIAHDLRHTSVGKLLEQIQHPCAQGVRSGVSRSNLGWHAAAMITDLDL